MATNIFYYPYYALIWIAAILTKTAFSDRVTEWATLKVDEEYYSGDVEEAVEEAVEGDVEL